MAHKNTKRNCAQIILAYLEIEPIHSTPLGEEQVITYKSTSTQGRLEVIEKFEVYREEVRGSLLIIMTDSSRIRIIE